jgi:hypothetical protein
MHRGAKSIAYAGFRRLEVRRLGRRSADDPHLMKNRGDDSGAEPTLAVR